MNLEEILKQLKHDPQFNLTPEESQRIKDAIIKEIRSNPLPTSMDFKHWYQSRTIRIAFIQAIFSILIAFETTYPELRAIGAIGIIKSLLDVCMRYMTDKPIL
jgi:hypothetical protein